MLGDLLGCQNGLGEMDYGNPCVRRLQHAKDQIAQLETSYPLDEDFSITLESFTTGEGVKRVVLLLAV